MLVKSFSSVVDLFLFCSLNFFPRSLLQFIVFGDVFVVTVVNKHFHPPIIDDPPPRGGLHLDEAADIGNILFVLCLVNNFRGSGSVEKGQRKFF